MPFSNGYERMYARFLYIADQSVDPDAESQRIFQLRGYCLMHAFAQQWIVEIERQIYRDRDRREKREKEINIDRVEWPNSQKFSFLKRADTHRRFISMTSRMPDCDRSQLKQRAAKTGVYIYPRVYRSRQALNFGVNTSVRIRTGAAFHPSG